MAKYTPQYPLTAETTSTWTSNASTTYYSIDMGSTASNYTFAGGGRTDWRMWPVTPRRKKPVPELMHEDV